MGIKEYKGISRDAKRIIATTFLLTFTVTAFRILFGTYLVKYGFSEEQVGSLLSLRTLGLALFSVPVAFLTTFVGRKRIIVIGMITMIVTSVVLFNSTSMAVLSIASFIFGAGHSTYMVNKSPFLFEHSSEKKRMAVFGLEFAMMNLSTVIASFAFGGISDLISSWLNMSSLLSNQIVLNGSLIAMILAIFTLVSIPDHTVKKDDEKITKESFKQLLRPKVLGYMLQVAIVGLGAGLVVPFFAIYIKHQLNASDAVVGFIMAFSQIGNIIGGLMIPRLTKRFGNVETVIGLQLLSIPFLISIMFPQGIIVLSVSFFFRTALMNSANPIIRSMAMDLVDANMRAFISSSVSLINNLMRSVGIFFGGWMMTNVSYSFPYLFTIIFYFVGSVVIYHFFLKNERKKSIQA